MKETLKRIKADIIVSALLCIALGIVLLVWPAETIDVFCKILAVGLIIMGGVDIASYFMNRSIHPFAGALGLIVLLIGIWIFLRPESIVSLIPIVIGVILCIHGIQDLKLAIETKRNGYENSEDYRGNAQKPSFCYSHKFHVGALLSLILSGQTTHL